MQEKKTIKNLVRLFGVMMLLLVLFACVLSPVLEKEIRSLHKEQLKKEIDRIEEEAAGIKDHKKAEKEAFDQDYIAKVRFIAYSNGKDAGFARTDERMKAYKDQLRCTKVLLLNRKGEILAIGGGSRDDEPDYSRTRYEELRSVFQEDSPSKPFEVKEKDGKTIRYYAARISKNTEVVIGKNTEECVNVQKTEEDWARIVSPALTTPSAYGFVVSDLTGEVVYDSRKNGREGKADTSGITGKKTGLSTRSGDLTGYIRMPELQAHMVLVLPGTDLSPLSNRLTGAVTAFLFVVMTMMVLTFREQKNRKKSVGGSGAGPAAMAARTGLLGTVLLLVFAWYGSVLYGLTLDRSGERLVRTSEEKTREAESIYADEVTGYYDRLLMNRAEAAARILGNNPDLGKREEIAAISKALDLQYILLYDKDMKEKATDSDYVNLNLSRDEDDPFYSLTKLRFGISKQIWGPAEDPITGQYHQYFGVVVKENGSPNGFILASSKPEEWLEPVYEARNQDEAGNQDGKEIGQDKDASVPEKTGEGRKNGAAEQEKDKHEGIDASASKKTGEGRREEAVKEASAGKREGAFTRALTITGLGTFTLLLFFFTLLSIGGKTGESAAIAKERLKGPEEEEAGQGGLLALRPGAFLKGCLITACACLTVCCLLPEHFPGQESIIYDVIKGSFRKGPGPETLTAGLIAGGVCILILYVLELMAKAAAKLAAKETGQIIRNVIRLFEGLLVFGLIGFCVDLTGIVPAGKGILPYMIPLVILILILLAAAVSSNSLAGDVVSGIWLVLTGAVHVGDVIRIGSTSVGESSGGVCDLPGGTVRELGLTHMVLETDGGERILLSYRQIIGKAVVILRQ